jgi:hypothetical protein
MIAGRDFDVRSEPKATAVFEAAAANGTVN